MIFAYTRQTCNAIMFNYINGVWAYCCLVSKQTAWIDRLPPMRSRWVFRELL